MEMNHVLVVEDDKEIREGVEIYLKSQGYEVFQAADGVEGLEVIEKEDIHLAIVDIMMPRMDGISMVVKLREKYDFPVIFLSAKSEEVDKIMGLNMGADDYVTKPFTPMELLARVNSQLRRYRRFMERLEDMLLFLIPNYIKEGKYQLVIGIGCTGGKHRSVTLANELYKRLKDKGSYGLTISHRDVK